MTRIDFNTIPESSTDCYIPDTKSEFPIPFIIEALTKINTEKTILKFIKTLNRDVPNFLKLGESISIKDGNRLKPFKLTGFHKINPSDILLSIDPNTMFADFSGYINATGYFVKRQTEPIQARIRFECLNMKISAGKMSMGKGRYYSLKHKIKLVYSIE